MQDYELSDEDKIIQALELYYKEIPDSFNEAIEKILWFYRCGKDIESSKGGTVHGNAPDQIYSFEYDDDYIYSAFLAQYGIDLQDIENLHWWKFKAMFKALKEENEFVKIMGYRSMDLSKIKDKEQKEHYKKMKQMYKIPKAKNEVKKINDIEEALINGKDLSCLL